MSISIATATTTSSGPVQILRTPDAARFSLRINPEFAGLAASALGCDLPDRIGTRGVSGGTEATRLGPDEWTVTAPEAERARIVAAVADLSPRQPHSLTDISDREVTLVLEGARVRDLLSIANPLDLRRFNAGRSARTVFDSAQIVLHCDGPTRFRISVWRSFLPHVLHLLQTGNAELEAGL